jgi:hypothetical protein
MFRYILGDCQIWQKKLIGFFTASLRHGEKPNINSPPSAAKYAKEVDALTPFPLRPSRPLRLASLAEG